MSHGFGGYRRAERGTFPRMVNRHVIYAIAGGFIALLALLEMIDQEATIWNVASLVIGVALFSWGLAASRRDLQK